MPLVLVVGPRVPAASRQFRLGLHPLTLLGLEDLFRGAQRLRGGLLVTGQLLPVRAVRTALDGDPSTT